MVGMLWLWALELARLGLRVALMFLCVRLVGLLWRSRRIPSRPSSPVGEDHSLVMTASDDLPRVTVQIPLRNEVNVAARAIEAAAALDYPSSRFEIQVLDDSDDETTAVVDAAAFKVARQGVAISVVRRATREGYKAGALQHGLATAKGDLIAILDADCVPPRDFLRRIVPDFAGDPRLALVQMRWDFLNRDQSALTRVQALLLDGLTALEQAIQSASGGVFQFNGCAGVWRRTALDAAGGVASPCITEDLELSARALLRGWTFRHRHEAAVATELPDTLSAFRQQQERWATGNGQVLRALGLKVLNGELPLHRRMELLLHLARKGLYLSLFVLTCTFPLTTLEYVRPMIEYPLAFNVATFVAVTGLLAAFFARAARVAGQSMARSLFLTALSVPLSIALSTSIAVGFVRGLCPSSAPFLRTPKTGGKALPSSSAYRVAVSPLALVECAFACVYAGCAWALFAEGGAAMAYGAFAVLVGLGFGWLGLGTLLEGLTSVSASRPVARLNGSPAGLPAALNAPHRTAPAAAR